MYLPFYNTPIRYLYLDDNEMVILEDTGVTIKNLDNEVLIKEMHTIGMVHRIWLKNRDLNISCLKRFMNSQLPREKKHINGRIRNQKKP